MYVCMYVCISIDICMYIHILFIPERGPGGGWELYYVVLRCITLGFHNFNLRNFNLRVSNPNKLIVDVCLTRCRISMCQSLGPKKHDEISEIDCIVRCVTLSYLKLTSNYLNVA